MFSPNIQADDDIQSKSPSGFTHLHRACLRGDLDKVKYLIQHIDVNSVNDKGVTPIHCALKNEINLDLFYFLVEHGADLTQKIIDGTTCLHMACRIGNLELVKYILPHIDINSQSEDGFTPLYEAISSNHTDVFNFLINSNADINIYKDHSALHVIAGVELKGNKEILHYAIKHFDINLQDEHGYTPLHIAAENGEFENVKFLVDSNCDINIKSNDGESALYLALGPESNRISIMEYLLERNAQIKPQYLAVCGNFKELNAAKLLLKYGADVNYQSDETFNMTVLLYSAWKGNTELAKFLIEECKADITLRNNNNRTALNFAAFGNNLELVKYLLEAGANPNIVDAEGKSPLLSSSKDGHYEIVDCLLQFNADIHIRNKHGGTALHTAAYHNKLDIVKLLVKHNADVNIEDNKKKT